MQELLTRIKALDPDASVAIRIIACFDELIIGRVNSRGLLAAAAALAGCAAGCSWPDGTTLRIGENGRVLSGDAPVRAPAQAIDEQSEVWLERSGPALANDPYILDRLALALQIRRGGHEPTDQTRRPMSKLLDEQELADERIAAAHALGLGEDARLRVVLAPLFARWVEQPLAPGDIVTTEFGPVHALVIADCPPFPSASLLGIGLATSVRDLPRSFRSALTALRLADSVSMPVVLADRFGGMLELLEQGAGMGGGDAPAMAQMRTRPWADRTIVALCESSSLRQAARAAGVHHSTMQSRVEELGAALGYDPLDAVGRTRLTLAYLTCRLQQSESFDLPPAGAVAGASGTLSSY